jgi:hypothetical protein
MYIYILYVYVYVYVYMLDTTHLTGSNGRPLCDGSPWNSPRENMEDSQDGPTH